MVKCTLHTCGDAFCPVTVTKNSDDPAGPLYKGGGKHMDSGGLFTLWVEQPTSLYHTYAALCLLKVFHLRFLSCDLSSVLPLILPPTLPSPSCLQIPCGTRGGRPHCRLPVLAASLQVAGLLLMGGTSLGSEVAINCDTHLPEQNSPVRQCPSPPTGVSRSVVISISLPSGVPFSRWAVLSSRCKLEELPGCSPGTVSSLTCSHRLSTQE